jgi:hypothetical protein
MEVSQLLDVLVMGQDIEVVVAGLPEVHSFAFENLGAFSLQDAQSSGKGLEFRLGQKQVDVLGHENVTEEKELVTLANSFERLLEDDAGVVVGQIGKTLITTEGNEVVVAFGLITLQTTRHQIILSRR